MLSTKKRASSTVIHDFIHIFTRAELASPRWNLSEILLDGRSLDTYNAATDCSRGLLEGESGATKWRCAMGDKSPKNKEKRKPKKAKAAK